MLRAVVAFIAASDVRAYLETTSTAGRFSDANIGSNIRAASAWLQRKTGRQFEAQDNTSKTFTTLGRAIINIPDLRAVDSVSKTSTTLTADEYDLLPDRHTSGIYTAIQFRVPYGAGWDYRSDSSWFDRNLDRPNYSSGWHAGYASQPNDLVIVGDWGYNPQIPGTAPTMPDDILHAVKVLAAFYTLRPASVLAGAQVTPEGALLTYRELPVEVRIFLEEWTLGEQAAVIAGV
jgi:hypothetical protein